MSIFLSFQEIGCFALFWPRQLWQIDVKIQQNNTFKGTPCKFYLLFFNSPKSSIKSWFYYEKAQLSCIKISSPAVLKPPYFCSQSCPFWPYTPPLFVLRFSFFNSLMLGASPPNPHHGGTTFPHTPSFFFFHYFLNVGASPQTPCWGLRLQTPNAVVVPPFSSFLI